MPYIGLRQPATCPACSRPSPLRLLWERVLTDVTGEWVARGRARQAREPRPPYAPNWECRGCGHRWSDRTDPDQLTLDASESRQRARLGFPAVPIPSP